MHNITPGYVEFPLLLCMLGIQIKDNDLYFNLIDTLAMIKRWNIIIYMYM